MGTNAIIASIDKELERLQEVRRLLVQRTKDIKPAAKTGSAAADGTSARPRLSAAARARIAEAQRKRWAAARKRAKP